MRHRWTIKMLEKATDNDILKRLVMERKSALNPYAPLTKRLSGIYESLDTEPSLYVVKPKLTMRVLWGASATGISFEEFDSQAELDGYLRALNDHAGWLESETHFPDENGKFEDLDEDTRKSLLVNYEEVDLEP